MLSFLEILEQYLEIRKSRETDDIRKTSRKSKGNWGDDTMKLLHIANLYIGKRVNEFIMIVGVGNTDTCRSCGGKPSSWYYFLCERAKGAD